MRGLPVSEKSELELRPGAGVSVLPTIAFGLLVFVLLVRGVNDGPVESGPMLVAGYVFAGLIPLCVVWARFRARVVIDEHMVRVRRLWRWVEVPRARVHALLLVEGSDSTIVNLVADVGGKVDTRAATFPWLRRRQYEQIASVLDVPYLDNRWWRSFNEGRKEASPIVTELAIQLREEHLARANVRPAWLMRALPVCLLYVLGALALVFSVPIGIAEGRAAGFTAVAVGLVMLAAGELTRRALRLGA